MSARVEILSSDDEDDKVPVQPAKPTPTAAAPTALHTPTKPVGPPKPPAGTALKRRGKKARPPRVRDEPLALTQLTGTRRCCRAQACSGGGCGPRLRARACAHPIYNAPAGGTCLVVQLR